MVDVTDALEIPERSRRLRRVMIGEREILGWFNALNVQAEFATFPMMPILPPGYRVEGVNYIHEYAGFSILVSHPSFDEVPLGYMVPLHAQSEVATMVAVRIQWPEGLEKPGGEE